MSLKENNLGNNCTNSDISSLKSHNKELFKLYRKETRGSLTKAQMEALSNMSVVIDKSNDIYFEYVGRYDLAETRSEITYILEHNKDVREVKSFLEEISELVNELLAIEYHSSHLEEEPFIIINGEHYMSKEYTDPINEIENKIKCVSEQIKHLYDSLSESKEISDLIKNVLEQIVPKIFSRKRISVSFGKFISEKSLIILSKKSINDWLPSVSLDKKLLTVYAHELFQAYHFMHMDNSHLWTSDEKSKIIKESLASYIAYKYALCLNEEEICLALKELWYNHDMRNVPCVGAQYIEKYAGLGHMLFKESIFFGLNKAYCFMDIATKTENNKEKTVINCNLKKGDVITFGKYPHVPQGKTMPIEWKVLDIKNNEILLISQYGLEGKMFNQEFNQIPWEKCSLRQWLNEDFYNKAFTNPEKDRILTTLVTADKNPDYNSDQGQDTYDKVFILSIKEANEYFKRDEERMSKGTLYCFKKLALHDDEGYISWWLRTSSDNECTSGIGYDGFVDTLGCNVINNLIAVRPVIKIKL